MNDCRNIEHAAELAEENRDFELALELWMQLGQNTQSPEFWCRAGMAAQELGRWHIAKSAFREALKIEVTYSPAMECFGSLYLTGEAPPELPNFQQAKNWFLKALSVERSARVLTFLGTAYSNLNDHEAAKRSFREAIDMDSAYVEAYVNLAEEERLGNIDMAIELLKKAIDIEPAYFRAHQQLGIMLQRRGEVLAAEYHFRRSLEIAPNNYWSTLYLANSLATQGRNQEAELYYRKAIELAPVEPSGKRFFAKFLTSLSRIEEANRICPDIQTIKHDG